MVVQQCLKGAAALALIWSTGLYADSYSDAQLLQYGRDAWEHTQCVKAARYLFAYELRNPPALQNNAHRNAVKEAIKWCENNTTVFAGSDGKFDKPGGGGKQQKQPSLQLQTPATQTTSVARRCDMYAGIAVAQNEASVRNNCGYAGSRWDSEYSHHFNWCANPGVSAAMTRTETGARQDLLVQCAP